MADMGMDTSTMGQYLAGFEKHLRVIGALSDTTVRSYLVKVEGFIGWAVEEKILYVSRKSIEGYMEHCFYTGNGAHTRFTKLIALRKFFRYLAYDGIVPEDITARIPSPKLFRNFIQKFTREEVVRLFAVMPYKTEKGIRDIVMLVLAAFAGLRIGEIIKLNMNDIIDDGNAIEVNIIKTKHAAYRTVYLWKSPSAFLRQWLTIRLSQGAGKDAPFLISYRRGDTPRRSRLTPSGIDGILKKYAGAAQIRKPAVHMHMLRATHASDLRYIRGYDVFAIAERLGHKDISTTGRYIPARGRISREYPSLAVYWRDFNLLWKEKREQDTI